MLYRLKLSAVFIFIFSLNMFSQVAPSVDLNDTGYKIWSYGSLLDDKASSVVGSQYFEKDFLSAKVSGLEDEQVIVRYNVVKDEIEFRKEGKNYEMFKTDGLVVKILKNNKVYKVFDFNFKGENKKGYLIALTEFEKVNFLTKEVITYVPFKEPSSAYGESVPAHYRHDKNVNFIQINSVISEMPRKKKDLLKLFPEHSNEVQAYLKTNKVDFNKESDLLILVRFLNTL